MRDVSSERRSPPNLTHQEKMAAAVVAPFFLFLQTSGVPVSTPLLPLCRGLRDGFATPVAIAIAVAVSSEADTNLTLKLRV